MLNVIHIICFCDHFPHRERFWDAVLWIMTFTGAAKLLRWNLGMLLNFLSSLVVCSNELMETDKVSSNLILSAMRNFDIFKKSHTWTRIKTRFSWNFSRGISYCPHNKTGQVFDILF